MLCKNLLKFKKSLPVHKLSLSPFFFSEQTKAEDSSSQSEVKDRRSIYDLNVAHQYVKENIKKFDWATYVAANYIPTKIRMDYYSIYWFYHELTRAVENTKESALGLGKMEFWNESIEKIFDDQPVKEPMSICLHAACKNNPLPKGLFLRMINAKKYEINSPECTDLSHFETIAELNRTTLLHIIIKLLQLDLNNDAIMAVAEHAGKCLGMIDFIRRVPFTLKRYKLFLPEDIMRKHNVSVRNLWNRIDGKPKDELFDVILEVAAHAKKHLEVAKSFQKDLPPNAFRAFLQCVEAEYFLEQLEKANFDIFNRSLHSPAYTIIPYRIFMAARKQTFQTLILLKRIQFI